VNGMAFDALRCEAGEYLGKQVLCARAVVIAEIADVYIEGYGADFRPGMDGQVRFGEDDRAGHAGGLSADITKGVEQTADDGQSMALAGVNTIGLQSRGIEEQLRVAATVVQVGDQVQSVHDAILLRST